MVAGFPVTPTIPAARTTLTARTASTAAAPAAPATTIIAAGVTVVRRHAAATDGAQFNRVRLRLVVLDHQPDSQR